MKNIKDFTFKGHHDAEYGDLIPIEAFKDIPFSIKRIYYIYNVPDNTRRGFHSHYDLEQMLICVKGSVKILTKTPFESKETLLDSPDKGLYIGPMIWREMYDFSEDAVLLVLASELYTPADYIRDYNEYEKQAISYFEEEKK